MANRSMQGITALRSEWNKLYQRENEIAALIAQIINKRKEKLYQQETNSPFSTVRDEDIKDPQLQAVLLKQKNVESKLEIINHKRITKETQDKLEEENRMLKNKLNLRRKRKLRLLSSATFKYLQFTNSPPPKPTPSVTPARKKVTIDMSDPLEKIPLDISPQKENLVEIAAKLAASPDSWSTLEPIRRRTKIADYRKFIQSGMDRSVIHEQEVEKLIEESKKQEAHFSNTVQKLFNNEPVGSNEEDVDPEILNDPEQVKELVATMSAKMKFLKEQYSQEVKKSINMQQEFLKTEAEKLDLVEHFSRLLDERDIELGYLQKSVAGPTHSVNVSDELGSNYYDDSGSVTSDHGEHQEEMGNVVEEKSDLDTVAEKIATTAQNPTAPNDEVSDFLEELEARYQESQQEPDEDEFRLDLSSSLNNSQTLEPEESENFQEDEEDQSERQKLDEEIKRIEEQQILRQREREQIERQMKEAQQRKLKEKEIEREKLEEYQRHLKEEEERIMKKQEQDEIQRIKEKSKAEEPAPRKTSFAPLPQFENRLNQSIDEEFEEFFAKANEPRIRTTSMSSETSKPLFSSSELETDHSSQSDRDTFSSKELEIPSITVTHSEPSDSEQDRDDLLEQLPPTNLIDMDFKSMVEAVNEKYNNFDFPFDD